MTATDRQTNRQADKERGRQRSRQTDKFSPSFPRQISWDVISLRQWEKSHFLFRELICLHWSSGTPSRKPEEKMALIFWDCNMCKKVYCDKGACLHTHMNLRTHACTLFFILRSQSAQYVKLRSSTYSLFLQSLFLFFVHPPPPSNYPFHNTLSSSRKKMNSPEKEQAV